MSRREDAVRLMHMREAAPRAIEAVRSRSREEVLGDDLLVLAVTRLVEILGEASKQISPELRRANPDVQWAEIAASRNRLVHAYFEVDPEVLWEILTASLPELLPKLDRMIAGGSVGG